jgi:hypothetical protein
MLMLPALLSKGRFGLDSTGFDGTKPLDWIGLPTGLIPSDGMDGDGAYTALITLQLLKSGISIEQRLHDVIAAKQAQIKTLPHMLTCHISLVAISTVRRTRELKLINHYKR